MKKVIGQTVRDLKREVNKKVLKVPGIEQKILDATSNEPWGPHGSHLADLAQATRNYQDYKMIMHVIWKRINDTGKNWRHVYKALTVLEYLVANGSERVIDEIRGHAHQISALSHFQYIDSGGRDQGSSVRRKSQSLVTLVNDKDKLQEARQKANANKDKFRSTVSTSSASRSSYGDRYDDDRLGGRYGYRDDDPNGNGRERDYCHRDDDRYGRGRDSYSQDGDSYGRDHEGRYGRDGYRDDDYQPGSRTSADRYTDRSMDEDEHHSSCGSRRGDTHSHDDRRPEHHLSEENVGAPPSYEEATGNGKSIASPGYRSASEGAPKATSPMRTTSQGPDHVAFGESHATPNKETKAFDEFDPRGFVSVAMPSVSSPDLDFFGSLSASDSTNSAATMSATSAATTSQADMPTNPGFGMDFAAPLDNGNPFGDSPFRATTEENFHVQPQNFVPISSINAEPFPSVAPNMETSPAFDFGDMLGGLSYTPHVANGQHSSATAAFSSLEMPVGLTSSDVLDDIFPRITQPTGPTDVQSASGFDAAMFPPSFSLQNAQPAAQGNIHSSQLGPLQQPGLSSPLTPHAALTTSFEPPAKTQPTKFGPKSTVWVDTLNRGLVDLNICGAKVNPLSDIGVDFDSINRMEKRKEAKSSAAPMISTVTMGKAMGAGSGIGRTGVSGIAPPPNPMAGAGMNQPPMGMAMNQPPMGMGMGMSMNQPPMGMGMGMSMNQPPMGMSMGHGGQMWQPNRVPSPGPAMPGVGYNPMTGVGNYSSQQQYGGAPQQQQFGGGYR